MSLQFTPDMPFAMKISGITFNVGRSQTGPRTFAIRTSVDNFLNNLPSLLSTSETNFSIENGSTIFFVNDSAGNYNFNKLRLSGNAFNLIKDSNSITFRIYAFNAEDETGYFLLDDLTLLGSYGRVENVQNYMEYSYCQKMFTLRQAEAMRSLLNNPAAQRNLLWTPSNLIETGVTNGLNNCLPKADFSTNRRFTCVGFPVTYKNNTSNLTDVTNTDISYSWSFPEGNPTTSNDVNATVTYSTFGWKQATLTATSATGGTSLITKTAVYIALNEPYYYADYNATSFTEPFDDPDAMDRWISFNPGNNGSKFKRVKLNDGSENHCLVLENFGQGKDKDILISPAYDIKFRTNVKLNFRMSGSTTQNLVNQQDLALILDSLKIYFSRNCGESWSTTNPLAAYTSPKADLLTGGNWNTPYFAANNVGWTNVTVNLPNNSMAETVRFMLRFSAGGLNTNNFFIDDINLSFVTSINELNAKGNWNLYPNPFYSGSESLSISSDLNLDNALVQITDALGREISLEQINLFSGINNKLYTETLNANSRGIYFIRVLKNNETKANFKFIKNF